MSIAVKEKKRPVRNLQKSNPDAPVSPMVIEECQQDNRAGYYDHIFELTPEEIENSETIAEFAAKNSLMSFREGKLSEVNRARVKEEAIGLISYEELKENNEAVGVKIIIEDRGDTNDVPYLSAFFDRLPYGIINKNRTGVGATTLEINSERHSIIVMPTKNLAFSKVLNGSKTESGKFRCNYVGSKMEEVKYEMPSISEYLQDDEIEYKKFIVVADSLHKVIEAIGASVYNEYFFMLDEIDSYQSDSTFRHSMADTLDYYFEFDAVQRCMVTATMQEFSNPKFRENDPVIEIKYPPLPKRKAHLIHTDNPNELTKEIIEELCERTQDQIVVAYNKIQYIMEIIENLDEKYKPDCAVLCSDNPYCDLLQNRTAKVVFFLSSKTKAIFIFGKIHMYNRCLRYGEHFAR